jgi:acetate kinase
MQALVLNPGGNSLKVEIVECNERQAAFEGIERLSAAIEGIGSEPKLSGYHGM